MPELRINFHMKILLVGGGSGGSISPLLAVAREIKLKEPKAKFILVGTKTGPERIMAAQEKMPFYPIQAGKWRRYFSLLNAAAPFKVGMGFFQTLSIIRKFKPDCVFGTGSFVQVPVVLASWVRGVPVVLHQQDVFPSLANSLCQFFADKITVTFEKSLTDFYHSTGVFYKKRPEKITLTGNPCRPDLLDFGKEEALRHFKLRDDLPVLYAVGGGTGARYINELVRQTLPELCRTVQVIHSTGPGKEDKKTQHPNYRPYEFIKQPGLAYAAADIVLCRAGLSTITELSALKKLAIIIPMPNSHQEINGALLANAHAAIVLRQERIKIENFVPLIRKLLFEKSLQDAIRENIVQVMPKNSGKKIADIIIKLAATRAWKKS